MKNVAEFLYRINDLGFSVWLENNNLKYRQYKEHSNKNEILDQIKENKTNIIKFLNINKCNSYGLINPQYIYTSGNCQEVLSFAQERLWFVEKYEKGTNAYNIPMVFRLNNAKLDILERSIRILITRHEILRTLIKEDEEGNGYQQVIDDKEFSLEIERINVKDKAQLDQELTKVINRVYDLSTQSLIRVCLYELNNLELKESTREYYLSIVIHHIAFDGWSIDILLKELYAYYRYYSEKSLGRKSKLGLPELSIQYKDFALWQRHYLKGERLEKQLNYWREKLNGYEILNLPTDKVRPNQFDYRGKDIYFGLDEKTSIALRELAKEFGVSLYSVLLAGYYLMLKCYSNQDDIVIGTPVANRHYSQIENLIGFFVNSLVLRKKIDLNKTVKKFIQEVGNEAREALLYQDLPFEKLVEKLQVAKDPSRHPIFQILFGVQSFGRVIYNQENIDIQDILQGYKTEADLYNIARFDISTFIDDSGICLNGSFNYAVGLYTEATINCFINTYVVILKEFTTLLSNTEKQEQTKLFSLNYLNEEQYRNLIYTKNQTDATYAEETIHTLFEEQVKRTPNNIAVVYENQSLTYQKLNDRANILADYLISLGAGPEVLIGIGIYRQIELIIGLIGILKTGAAYVPLDPEYPDERLRYMIEDSNLQLLLVTGDSKEKFNYFKKQFVYVEETDYDYNKINRSYPPFSTPDNLAYVTYTSGSTGKPKGVASHHRGVINRLRWAWDKYPFSKDEICCLQSSICFVDSTWDIFGTLLIGFPLILYKPSVGRNVESFLQQCFLSKITRITLLPSFLSELIKLAQTDINIFNYFKQVKHLEVTGEFFKADIFLNFMRTFGRQIVFLDCYGATEATSVIYKDFKHESKCLTRIISNTKIYVLSNYLTPISIGSIGELYIGGVGLARGYLNKPEFTAERFIPNPFLTEEEIKQNKNLRLYKTGDLVRWLPDGNIEYLGRNDFQVKIRGYRIELGEIESILSSYEGIKHSVVIAKDHKNSQGNLTDNRYLVGYYVSAFKLDEEDILNYLKARLPEYMVPAVLVYLEQLPLTGSGKIDRKQLPDPEFTNIDGYIAPRNELEIKVCQIWGEILGLPEDKIGIVDDFFRLGGNSILAIKLASKLNKELNISINISSIFKHNTVAKFVMYLEHKTEEKVVIEKAIFTKMEKRALSFAQERLWFIEKYENGTNAYNMPHIFKLSNNTKIDILERSILSIVSRHEVLRTLIKEDTEGNSYQLALNVDVNPFKISRLIVNSQRELNQEIKKEANQLFDLSTDIPIRVCLYEVVNSQVKDVEKYYLSIVIHHIAFDGWSYVIFFKELQAYYEHYLKQSQGLDSELNLPNLSIQYADFALWQRNYLSGEQLDTQINYWKQKLEGYETLNLPTDKVRPNVIEYKGGDIYFEFDESMSLHLRELAKELKVSLYSLLLAGYYLMLRSYSNQDDIIIGTLVANRHYREVENLVGFFVNTLVLRTQINSKLFIKDFIQKIGQEIVEAQLHQDLPFEKLVDELRLDKDTSRHPIFQVVFGVQGFGGEIYNKLNEQKANNITNLLLPYSTDHTLFNIAKFDISTFIDDSESCLKGSFNYAVSLYKEDTIKGFIETYLEILRQFAELCNNNQVKEQKKVAELHYLNEEQYGQIIYKWNETEKAYPSEKTIHELFEEQVERTPDHIAIVYQERKLSYRELNNRANQLANYLRERKQITRDSLIGVCLHRSEHMLIGLLAVLKAGGAYVPIDPSYPDDRIGYVLRDTKVRVVLSHKRYQERLETLIQENANPEEACKSGQVEILGIDSEKLQEVLISQAENNIKTETTSANLAYVIYTSGTVGHPKGVMIEHKAVISLVKNINYIEIDSSDSFIQFSDIAFDAAIFEIWGALLNGAKLFLPSNIDLLTDINLIETILIENKISILWLTKTLFDQLFLMNINIFQSIKFLIVGGEALSKLLIYKLINLKNSPANVINGYGPTENATFSCTLNVKRFNVESLNSIPIGRPLTNRKAYVLDPNLNPVPIGGIGELYVGGVGLARGYLNRPELTAERFIVNPFQSEAERRIGKNSRLYKTGDLVRWLGDGNLEYLGRNDFQVKIRGYRIEPGEIESVLSSYAEIKQSVVMVRGVNVVKDGASTQYLCGYYVSERPLEEAEILKYLSAKLPEYMIPNRLMQLERLPLTINGKLDRKALPDPEFTNRDMYVAPRNELENTLCQIWGEVLSLDQDRIGIKDDFFRLGGNSILAIKLASMVNNHYQAHLKVSDIFVYKNVEQLLLRILQTKDAYQTIIKLNNTFKKPNMFMIHPGIGGCEVYISLANKLNNSYSCYGVDSYNLYHHDKIDKMYELAKYYLSYIDKVMVETHQEIYHLFGWSLGGQIALEIAYILEQRGDNNIKVYLLDSVICDERLFSALESDLEKSKELFREEAVSKGFDPLYIERSLSNMDVEMRLSKQKISSSLANTQALFFKAMLGDKKYKIDEYHNIDKCFRNKSDIKLIKVNDAHHGNILEQEELLISEITRFNSAALETSFNEFERELAI